MADYQVWECQVCGWIYDEAKGWPEDGIEPGTRWADVPEDWLCPECGVGKDDFEMVSISATPAPTPTPSPETQTVPGAPSQPPIVIVGTGLAGYSLARELRKREPALPLLIITADDGSFYSKPVLSTGFHKQKTAADLVTQSARQMAESLNAEVRIFTRVTAVDTEAHELTLRHGERTVTLRYHKLVLALGSDPIALNIEGDAGDDLYTVNDLQDYARFQTAATGKRRVLIMGAGLIGSEYANDLAQAGFSVDIVDPMASMLSALLPDAVSRPVQAKLTDAGVRFHLGTTVTRIDRRGVALQASLANGTQIDTDLVLSAVGVRARTQLASDIGLQVARGIVTDRLLQTSAPDVYALGDCAEVDGHLLYYITPLFACARALAATLTGEPTPVHYGAMPVTVKTTLMPVAVCPPPRGVDGRWQTQHADNAGAEAHFHDAAGALRGFALCGNRLANTHNLSRQLPPLMGD